MINVAALKGYLDDLQTAENALATKRAAPSGCTLEDAANDLADSRAAFDSANTEWASLSAGLRSCACSPASLLILP